MCNNKNSNKKQNTSFPTRDSILEFQSCLSNEPSSTGSIGSYSFDDESQDYFPSDIIGIDEIDNFFNGQYNFEFLPISFLSN